VRLADYYGKIRLIMLHTSKFASQSACPAPITCDASSIRAIDPGIGAYSLESFSTPNRPINHILAVTEELVTHIVALLLILWPQISKNKLHFWRFERLTTHCHKLIHRSESLPGHAADYPKGWPFPTKRLAISTCPTFQAQVLAE